MSPTFHLVNPRRMALTVAALAMVSAPAMAADNNSACGHMAEMSHLSVSGDGLARIAPDMATIQLGVTGQADSANAAMDQNSTQQAAVIKALTDTGIEQAQIQTSGLNLSPLMKYDEDRAPSVTGYQASNIVTVRVADLTRLGEVLDAIVNAGANEISGITFAREDGADAQDDARRQAVTDARRKAQVLAEAAGLTLGPVLTIRDSQSGGSTPRPMMRMEAAMADSVPVQAGQMEMSAQVDIEYALVGDGSCSPVKGGDVPLPGDGAPAPDEPIAPGIVEPLPDMEEPAN
ncbi:SIMPL domain-containing protein [Paracoccus sp. JM45]|uniref:SIMPL domain-containing protein n=1 Tax=Paracoccus sp. JM45 TaxID=2283626 RepID=UPI000E6CF618|nr:SIMPL domain-containing protein [Paracoccus sp. JM45]RJE80182.1 SIMPL domain-containing protein [Paracoccus sp. JM45]